MKDAVAHYPDEVVAAAQKAVAAAEGQVRRKSWRELNGNTTTTVRNPHAFHQITIAELTDRVHIQTIPLDSHGRVRRGSVRRLDLPREVTLDNVDHLVAAANGATVANLIGMAEDLAGAKPLRPDTYLQASRIVFSQPHPPTRYGDPIRAAGGKIKDMARRTGRKLNPFAV